MVLTLHNELLFLGQWHNTFEVTNSTARTIQEPDFCHDNFKNLAKMRQAHQGAVRLCQKVMTLQWYNGASFYVVVTIIQIMCTTEGTALFEQSSLFFIVVYAFLVCYRKLFPCAINVAEVWNSPYVVLIIKCVFILNMVCFLSFLRHIIYSVQLVEKVCDVKYYVKNILLNCNSVFPMWHFHQRFSS